MLQDIQKKAREGMEDSLRHLANDLKRIRAGRASVTLLDPIRVHYYGNLTPVKEIASISVPEADLIVIQPWDTGVLGELTKAIQKSDLGVNPINDGKVVRIKLPQLTEERRKELAKQARKTSEDAKVGIRNHRHHANDSIKKLVKSKEVSEDDSKHAQDHVQKLTDDYIKKVDQMVAEKEKEIMSL